MSFWNFLGYIYFDFPEHCRQPPRINMHMLGGRICFLNKLAFMYLWDRQICGWMFRTIAVVVVLKPLWFSMSLRCPFNSKAKIEIFPPQLLSVLRISHILRNYKICFFWRNVLSNFPTHKVSNFKSLQIYKIL